MPQTRSINFTLLLLLASVFVVGLVAIMFRYAPPWARDNWIAVAVSTWLGAALIVQVQARSAARTRSAIAKVFELTQSARFDEAQAEVRALERQLWQNSSLTTALRGLCFAAMGNDESARVAADSVFYGNIMQTDVQKVLVRVYALLGDHEKLVRCAEVGVRLDSSSEAAGRELILAYSGTLGGPSQMIAIAQRLLRSSGDPHYLFLAVCCLLASSDDADGSAAIVAEELILSFAGTLDVGLDAQQRVLLAESIFRQEGRLRDALTVLDVGLKALSLQSEPDDDRGILLRAYERMLAGDAAPLTDRDLEIVEELLEQTFEWAVHARVVTRVNDYAARYLAFLRRLSSERDGDPGPRLAELALMESMCARRGPDSDGDLLALQQLRRFLDDFADTFNGRANSLGPELRRVVVALFRRRPGDVVDALVRALERCRQAALCAVNLSYLLSCCEFDSTHVFRGKLAPASVVLAYRASEQALRGPLLAHTALLLLAELRQDPSASVAQSIDAVALCLSVISEYPDSASALMLSVIPHLRRLGAASVAVPFVPQLLEAPEKILIAHSLGLLLLDAGMEDEALDLFQFVIDVHDKAEREALIAFGALLDSGSFVAALWAYRQAERTAGSLYRLSAEYEVVQLGADSDDKALAEIMERVGTAAGRSGVEGTYDLVSYEVLGQFETSVDAESAFRTKLIERRVNFLHGLLSCLRHLRDKDLKAALESLGAAEQLGAVSQSDEGCASRRCIIAVARLCCGSGSPADCDDALADLRLTLLDPSSLYLAPFLANVCTWAPVFVGAASRDVVIYSVALKLRDLQAHTLDAILKSIRGVATQSPLDAEGGVARLSTLLPCFDSTRQSVCVEMGVAKTLGRFELLLTTKLRVLDSVIDSYEDNKDEYE